MSTGHVKWFNNAKGFGFILPDDGGGDLFAHYSAISMDGYKTLKAGQVVSFDAIEGPKGMHAANIKVLSDPDLDWPDDDAEPQLITEPAPEPESEPAPEPESEPVPELELEQSSEEEELEPPPAENSADSD